MSLTRRELLKNGAAAGVALAAPAVINRASAQSKTTVRMLSRSHFIPEYDAWVKSLAAKFEAESGIQVITDHIAQTELAVRYTSEVSSRSGHDVVELTVPFAPLPIYQDHLADVSDVAEDLASRHGGWLPVAEAYCRRGKTWKGILNYYNDHSGCYRKDLFDKVGEPVPSTWEGLLQAGRKLKNAGNPIGLQFSRAADPTAGFNQMLWSFDASWVGADGKTITVRSPQVKETLKFAKQLYDETMTPEVLSWDDAANNRFMISGRGSFTLNAPSVYWFGMKQNPSIAQNIYHTLPPAGPRGTRVGYAFVYGYGIWDFSPNIPAAKKWLTFLMDNWMSGFANVVGYNYPPLNQYADQITPELEKIANLADLKRFPPIARPEGYPGPFTPAVAEVSNAYIIPDMFVRVARGESADEATAWAERQIAEIFKKHGV
jgi:multiple sugar transport system substrate-binding protein